MGYGDELMALGDAWRVHQADPRRRRVAIGDGKRLWCDHPELRRGLARDGLPPAPPLRVAQDRSFAHPRQLPDAVLQFLPGPLATGSVPESA